MTRSPSPLHALVPGAANLELALDIAAVPLLVVQAPAGQIVYANRNACERLLPRAIVGLNARDVLGAHWQCEQWGAHSSTWIWREVAAEAHAHIVCTRLESLRLPLYVMPLPNGAAAGDAFAQTEAASRRDTLVFLSTVVQALPQPVFVKDEEHRWILLNHAYCELMQRKPEELLGKTDREVYPSHLAALFWEEDDRALASDEPIAAEADVEYAHGIRSLIRHKRRVELDGMRYIVGITLDVTRQRQNERELLALTRQREEEERLRHAALVREVHHRIKNNLQGVVGLLRRQSRRPMQQAIEAAIAQVQALAAVYALHESQETASIPLAPLCRAIAEGLQAISERPIDVSVSHLAEMLAVAPDHAVSLALVINELVTNAVKHAADGSEESVVLMLQAEERRCSMILRNAGCLPADFDFEHGRGLGTGLGLARALIPAHGMAVQFAREDSGVRVQIELTPPCLV